MDTDAARAAGWDAITWLTPAVARLYGCPDGQWAFRKLVADGSLVAVLSENTGTGYAFALTHCAQCSAAGVVPGRMPTLAEVYGARRVLIPNETVLMVAILEPMSFALRLRWERVHSAELLPTAPGLPTTVKCVQMYCEGVTEDCVFGTQDIPTPSPVVRLPAGPAPVGPVPDELLGDADAATLDEIADADPDDEEP